MTSQEHTAVDAHAPGVLVSIEVREIVAARRSAAAITSIQLQTEANAITASDSGESSSVATSYTYTVLGTGEANETIAEVKIDIVVVLGFASEPSPDTEQLRVDAEAFGRMAAHPYARELIAELTRRIGIPSVMLGMLGFGETRPRTISIGDGMVLTMNDAPPDPAQP